MDRPHVSLHETTTLSNNKTPRFTSTSISTHLNHFQTQQSGGAAEFLAPLSAPGSPLPEMGCFDPNRCHCLGYFNNSNKTPRGWRLTRPKTVQPSTCRTSKNYQLGPLLDINNTTTTATTTTPITHSWIEALDPYNPPPWSCRKDPTCPNYFLYLERPLLRTLTFNFHMSNWNSLLWSPIAIKDNDKSRSDDKRSWIELSGFLLIPSILFLLLLYLAEMFLTWYAHYILLY